MSEYVLKVVELTGVTVVESFPSNPTGQYVESYDPDAFDGFGTVKFSKHEDEAKVFQSHRDAMEFWNQSSKVRPKRADGKPNRPLTAFSIEVVKLSDHSER